MKKPRSRVIYVGGSKGGVGKSLVSIAIIDWLRSSGTAVALIEGDQANPDVYKCYEPHGVPAVACNFDDHDGWAELANTIEQYRDHTLVVNSGARVIDGVQKHGYMLERLATVGEIDLEIVWPINRLRDSIIALKDFRKVVGAGRVSVIRNLFFGTEKKFTRWSGSSYAASLVAAGAKVGDLHELPDRIIDQIYDDRKPLESIEAEGSLADKTTVWEWRRKTHAVLRELL